MGVIDAWGRIYDARVVPDHMIERCRGVIVTAASDATVYLASDSTGYITGQTLSVNDGVNML